jgi:hypothetical protein
MKKAALLVGYARVSKADKFCSREPNSLVRRRLLMLSEQYDPPQKVHP